MPDGELCQLPCEVQWAFEGRQATGDAGAIERRGDVVI